MSDLDATVLCVDVDRQLLGILRKAFEREGFDVLDASDGEAAFRLTEEARPDLVILDITLPKRDGFAVLDAIRGLPDPVGSTPVLLTCGGRVTPQYEARATTLGAQAILGKPVPLKDLVARARDLLPKSEQSERSKGRGAAATPSGKTSSGARVVASNARNNGRNNIAQKVVSEDPQSYVGSLAEIRLPHALHQLHGMGATGVLMVSSARKKKAIELQAGRPVAVQSNLVTECLGNYLVRAGQLSKEMVTESFERVKRGEGRQGEILVSMELLSQEEIDCALLAQAAEKLYEMFLWRHGEFRLAEGSRLKRANALELGVSPGKVILEGIRRKTDIDEIDAFFSRYGKSEVRIASSPRYPLEALDVGVEEKPIITAVGSGAPLEKIAVGDERIRRTVYGLVVTELLELSPAPDSLVVSIAAPTCIALTGDELASAATELAESEERLLGKSHFDVLGVDERADDAAIEEAFRFQKERTDPARFADADASVRSRAEDLYRRVCEANEVLSDPEARKHYSEEIAAKGAKGAKGGSKPAGREKGAAARERASRAEAAFLMGEDLLREKSYDAALRQFGLARKSAPREADYLAQYAWCLYLCNPNNATVQQEALAHLREATRLAGFTEKPYLLLGRLNKVLGDTRGAEEMFRRAVQIQPDCLEALRELRLLKMRKGKTGRFIGKLIRR